MNDQAQAAIDAVELLIVEDSAEDLELIGDALREGGLEPSIRRVEAEPELRLALNERVPDAILADWTLPEFSGARALQIARELAPDVPFLFVSGTISEAAALSALRQGAVDYVFKHQLDKLGPAVLRAISEARGRRALVTSEERYRGLFETAIDGILILEANSGRILEANPFICNLLGMTAPQLLGRQLWELGVIQDRDKAREIFRRLQQEGYVRHDDLPLVAANGQQLEVEFVSNRYSAGGSTVMQCNIRDISDRRGAERLALQYQGEVLQSLHQIVAALVSLNEARDPYTAGHELRVSALASAIATAMQLSPQQVEGIRISGLVHDIGKFTIPAEILTKPTRLSPEELALVRTHAEAGYEALRPIAFPWPVAEAVRQHHERLDGSGYPQGLKGDQISLEARILAVADTVEAMATNRPYRHALGIEAALAIVEAEQGLHYDPAPVAACLKLFRQQGYAFAPSRY
ncbi:MAG: HD domain-containing phosphohydrolase [Synechococcaceae cyanobacterium ELA739]